MFRLIALLAFLFSAYASADNRFDVKKLEESTEKLVSLITDSNAEEYKDARQYHQLNQSGLAIVFFTIEGFGKGNNYEYYMAVFSPACPPVTGNEPETWVCPLSKYRLVGYAHIGGKLWRSVNFSKFDYKNSRLILYTKEYEKKDPTCCPSRAGKVIFEIKDNQTKLIELK